MLFTVHFHQKAASLEDNYRETENEDWTSQQQLTTLETGKRDLETGNFQFNKVDIVVEPDNEEGSGGNYEIKKSDEQMQSYDANKDESGSNEFQLMNENGFEKKTVFDKNTSSNSNSLAINKGEIGSGQIEFDAGLLRNNHERGEEALSSSIDQSSDGEIT